MVELDGFGNNVSILRLAQGLTQEETAFRSLLSVSHLQSIEYGYINATVETLRRIARTLKVSPSTLGVFSWPDHQILSVIRSPPTLMEYTGQTLNMFQNIALLRKVYGFTQRQLASLSHVSVATIRNLEHSLSNVSIATLICIANAFDTSLLKLAVLTTPEAEFMAMVHEARMIAGISVAA